MRSDAHAHQLISITVGLTLPRGKAAVEIPLPGSAPHAKSASPGAILHFALFILHSVISVMAQPLPWTLPKTAKIRKD
jgi:hypothetical protein